MAHYSGQSLYVSYRGVDIANDHRGLDISDAVKEADTTAGADTSESYIFLTDSSSFDLSIIDSDGTVGQAIRAALKVRSEGTLIIGPEGSEAGKPKFACIAGVNSVKRSYPFDNVTELKYTLKRNGAWLVNGDDGSVF